MVGFDNAHQVPGRRTLAAAKDHRHCRLHTVRPYDYASDGSLLAAFWQEVESVMRDKGVWT